VKETKGSSGHSRKQKGQGPESLRLPGSHWRICPLTDAFPITVEMARTLYVGGEQRGGHDFDHVCRVVALAERIALAESANRRVVRTAALLHDVGEIEGRKDHHLRGAAMARLLLAEQPAEFVEAVAHAIEAHRFRGEPAPRTLEAQVVSDADKLDAIGATGIARVFAYAGARGTALWRAPQREIAATNGDAISQPTALGGDYTPVHEFVYKLDLISERLYTATARAMGLERRKFMRAFFDRLDEEMLEVRLPLGACQAVRTQ
jgi:uncharacterized protein